MENIKILLETIENLGFKIENNPNIIFDSKTKVPRTIELKLTTHEGIELRKENHKKLKEILHPKN